MFIDTHTHLFVDAFDRDRKEVVQRAIDHGVEALLLPNIDVDTIDKMNELANDFPNNCFPMMGIHPCDVKEDWENQLEIIKKELFSYPEKYIAVGEIGIDLYWDKTHIEEQKEVFKRQIKWAKELQKPIVIHARDSFDEIFEIVDELNDDQLTGVFHCFTGTKEQAEKIINYGGFKIGIGGVITYKKAKVDEAIRDISLKHIVLETDSPYLAPVPKRGKRNESAYILHIAEKLTDIYQVPLLEIEKQTTLNAIELFNLKINDKT